MKKNILIILISLIIIIIGAGATIYYLGIIDTYKIKEVLKGTEKTFEQEDIDGLMSYVSLQYADDSGFNYPMAKRLISDLFKDFDKLDAIIENPVITIEDDKALVQFNLWITVGWNGNPAYILGTNQAGKSVRVHLQKIYQDWKVVKISLR